MERIETPAIWRKLPVTETPVPGVAAPAPYSAEPCPAQQAPFLDGL